MTQSSDFVINFEANDNTGEITIFDFFFETLLLIITYSRNHQMITSRLLCAAHVQGCESTESRPNCFEISLVDGCTHCLSIETREELLQLEKAWYKATYIAVKQLAVSIYHTSQYRLLTVTNSRSLT